MGDKGTGAIGIGDVIRIVAPIAERHGVERVHLFGSTARGDNGQDSDVDLLVDPGAVRNILDLFGMMDELEEALGRSVDVVTTGSLGDDRLSGSIIRDAVVVYDRADRRTPRCASRGNGKLHAGPWACVNRLPASIRGSR